jgi:hypothetical protein
MVALSRVRFYRFTLLLPREGPIFYLFPVLSLL